MQASDIIQPTVLSTPVAVDGIKNTIPTDPPSSSSNLASITEGFPSITMKSVANGGLPPMGQDFNGLFYLSTDQKVYLQNGGIITFNADVSTAIGGYPQGAVLDYVDSNGIITKVQSLIDNNTYNFVTTPSYIDGTHWQTILMGVSNKLTNCILSAPNGVATYSGNTITVKQGLKVLMPNGLNPDKTLKNIEHTVPSDVSYTGSTSTSNGYIIYYNIGIARIFWDRAIFIQEEEPSNLDSILPYSAIFWFKPSDNKWYYLDINTEEPYSWSDEYSIIILGIIDRGGTTTIQSLIPYQPVELLKRTDKEQIASWGFPSSKYVDLSLGASGQTYTAPADGWFAVSKLNGSSTVAYQIALVNQTANFAIEYRSSPATAINGRTYIPAKKGDIVQVAYDMVGATQYFRFIYAKGATND